MKRLILVAVVGAVAALASCEDPAPREEMTVEAAPEPVIEAPAAEDVAESAADSAVDAPPADPAALPPETRTSEETVQPESETLFY